MHGATGYHVIRCIVPAAETHNETNARRTPIKQCICLREKREPIELPACTSTIYTNTEQYTSRIRLNYACAHCPMGPARFAREHRNGQRTHLRIQQFGHRTLHLFG